MDSEYWGRFYAESVARSSPSQFAAFCLSEYPELKGVLELGCGNFRDSRFFTIYGLKVLATDCTMAPMTEDLSNNPAFRFESFCIGKDDPQKLAEKAGSFGFDREWAIYARFLLHALSELERAAFWKCLGTLMEPGNLCLLETRLPKELDSDEPILRNHSRNYVDLETLLTECNDAGLAVERKFVSRGVAAFKSEDPLVLRLALRLE